jgi:hypothetical protein
VLGSEYFSDVLESFHPFFVGLGDGEGISAEGSFEDGDIQGCGNTLCEHGALVVAAQTFSFGVQGYRYDGIYGGAIGVVQQFFAQRSADHHADVWFVVVFQEVQGFLDGAFLGKVVSRGAPLQGQSSPEAGGTGIIGWMGEIEGNILVLAAQAEAGATYGKILLAGHTKIGVEQVEKTLTQLP